MTADEFEAAMRRLAARWREDPGLTPEEVEQRLEPYRSFLALMRENDIEDGGPAPVIRVQQQ